MLFVLNVLKMQRAVVLTVIGICVSLYYSLNDYKIGFVLLATVNSIML